MKNKKIHLFLAVIFSALMIISGCASGLGREKEPITISIWHVYGAQTDSPLNDLIQTFNETVGAEQGIRVEVTMVSNNKNIHKDILAASNGDPGAPALPDIFVAYPSTILAMPDENILVDYYDYFSEEELSGFIPAFLQDGVVNDRLVSLPVAKSTELMFINQTAFDRFSADTGVRVENLSTWEDLFEVSCRYYEWTDSQTPDIPDDGKTFFVHDFHFNLFQTGVRALGEAFFENETLAFGPAFRQIWESYAKASLSGGIWLYDGYATEPLRTGESIVSVASSASVLYFSEEVIYSDNTSENIKLTVHPIPVFQEDTNLVMQRGAGMCTVKSTPEREKAAVTFLKWLVEPERNTEFAISTGYMPVTQEAFDTCLPREIENLTEGKYIELYKAYQKTQEDYTFYSAPLFDSYLETETTFEEHVRRRLSNAREEYLRAEERDEVLLNQMVQENFELFREFMQ